MNWDGAGIGALAIMACSAMVFDDALAGCQRSVDGKFRLKQQNGFTVSCTLDQEGFSFDGNCKTNTGTGGEANGTLKKGRFRMKIDWGASVGEYTAFVDGNGNVLDGKTFDVNHPTSWSTWDAVGKVACAE